jgi:hypothetical protein
MNTAELLEQLQETVNSPDFLSRHRIDEKAFSRKRILTFPTTMAIILNSVRDSTSAELDKFSDYFGTTEPTKSAFSQARHKIKETAFIELNDKFIKEYYYSSVKIKFRKRTFFNNLTLLAIDGYDLQLPCSSQIVDYFGSAGTNASGKKIPMSSASELYDLENGLTICALNMKYTSEEREVALKLIKNFLEKIPNKKEFVFIFDRGYPSLFFLACLTFLGIKFVMRCNTQFLSEVNEARIRGKKDQIIELPLKKLKKVDRNKLIGMFPDVDFSDSLTIRICLITLSTGETEMLLTSLINKKEFPYKLFKQLYSKRWGIETDIGLQKNRMEIENFSGESILSVQQEFHSTILFKNVTNLLIKEAEAELFELEIESESELIEDEIEMKLLIDGKCELVKDKQETETIGSKEINYIDDSNTEVMSRFKILENEKPIDNNLIKNDFQKIEVENLNFPLRLSDNRGTVKSVCKLEKNKKVSVRTINRSIAHARMKNRFIKALFDPDADMDFFCKNMKKIMKKNLEPIRPGRKFARQRKYPGKKFHKNSRRVS